MAVEKMEMMNIVGHLDDLDHIMREIILLDNVHPVDAINEINVSNLKLCMVEESVDDIVNMYDIKPYQGKKDYKNLKKKLEYLMENLDMHSQIKVSNIYENYSLEEITYNVDMIYEKFINLTKEMLRLRDELEKIQQFAVLKVVNNININLRELKDMQFFNFRIGVLKTNDSRKLSFNYENISVAVLHIGIFEGDEVYMILSPKEHEVETQRILNSVYFNEIKILDEYLNYPNIALENMGKRRDEIEVKLIEHQNQIDIFNQEFGTTVQESYSQLMMEIAIETVKEKIAFTSSFFYFSGWIPLVIKDKIKLLLDTKFASAIIVEFEKAEDVESNSTPPTRLKNNYFLEPFELLVKMYGTPSYNEVDPTMFLAITYMLLFGAMFGDLGQGFVLILSGFLLGKKGVNKQGTAILVRLGISYMIFGFFYDSFFGYEHVISDFIASIVGISLAENLFIRPIENINTLLIASITLGVVLLMISFGYSIFNKLKQDNIQEGIFGRNGVAGIFLYILLISYILNIIVPTLQIPTLILKLGIGIMVLLIIFREPLTNIIFKKRPLYNESASEYYLESGFDILETFLSLLSNSISFIRVGAFALNHVGLFIAFHTMANIIGGLAGNIVMFIIGNLIVIFLEGLIVFIQGLRLVYYEIFSKYYIGDGIEFDAVKLK
ncbi:MAG: V-type ATPase 116kDa subunit family protein [Acidaminobacteraceae bacterium]